MKYDAIIEVRFMTAEEGGRKTPVGGPFYACPLFVEGQGFDCRLLLEGRCLELGNVYEVPVKFMNSELALAKLAKGTGISLWEGRSVATGRILEITT